MEQRISQDKFVEKSIILEEVSKFDVLPSLSQVFKCHSSRSDLIGLSLRYKMRKIPR